MKSIINERYVCVRSINIKEKTKEEEILKNEKSHHKEATNMERLAKY